MKDSNPASLDARPAANCGKPERCEEALGGLVASGRKGVEAFGRVEGMLDVIAFAAGGLAEADRGFEFDLGRTSRPRAAFGVRVAKPSSSRTLSSAPSVSVRN